MLKTCKACLVEKDISDFYFRQETNNYKNVCKKCCIDGVKIKKDPFNKICKHCGVSKPFSEYQKAGGGEWLQPYCKQCDANRKRRYCENNAERLKEKYKNKYLANRVISLAKDKEKRRIARIGRPKRTYKRMPDEERKRRKSLCDKQYRAKKGEELIKKKKEYNKGRGLQLKKEWQKIRMNDPEFRITKNLRGRIYVALKRGIKSESTMSLLGCKISEFVDYFGSLFTDGMSWDEYMKGGIHIDHKKPCASFDLTKAPQQKLCFHYTNLQPLWALDNLKKASKVYEDH